MQGCLNDVFSKYGIEYYAVLSYSDCREISPAIMCRESFQPRSVIVYLLPYYSGETVNISRYAASLDYHLAIREIGADIISALRCEFADCNAVAYGDHSPIDEINAALISGLGIIGDNGLLINEKYGSYVFIGDVVTDVPPELIGAIEPRSVERCEGCGACKRACPTRVLSGEGNDCLSAITQKKGELSEYEESLMRKYNTVWGCDLCQSSCPHNRHPLITPVEFFHRERIENLTRSVLDNMDKAEFSRRAFAWRGRRTVERNLDLFEKK